MIRFAQKEDMFEVIESMKESHKKYDGRLFLDGVMKNPNIYVLEENKTFEGASYVVDKILRLHDKRLKVSYITASSMNDDGLRKLQNYLSKQDIITLIQADNPEDLESLGFEPVIEVSEFNINVDTLPRLSVDGIVMDPNYEKLLKVYQSFTKHFTGYFERNVEYYNGVKRLLGARGGIIAYEENGNLVAYIIFESYENVVIVHEACYQTSGHLIKLLAFAGRGKRRMVIQTSSYEHLSKIFPQAKKTKHAFLMAYINDKTLFENLFHIKIISAYSGFNAFGKALWNRDIF